MLHEEVEKYINLSGDKEAWQNTSVSRIGGYLDGYDKGLEVLDKIRAEIKALTSNRGFLSCSVDSIHEEIDAVFDKYKAESEPQESKVSE